MRARFRAAFVAAAALLAAGCVPATTIVPVDSLEQLEADRVLVVGKVELVPPLAPGEQDLGENYEEYRNRALLITGSTLRDPGDLSVGDMKRAINATFGETFFVSHPAESFFLLKGWVVMRAKFEFVAPGAAIEEGNAPLFGAFQVDVRPGDKAVYIGTIRYRRDAFFTTEKVVVVDEFAEAQAEFRRSFGGGAMLRKALARPLKPQ